MDSINRPALCQSGVQIVLGLVSANPQICFEEIATKGVPVVPASLK